MKEMYSLELGGNKNAADHFKRYGINKPYDYRSANAQKYKQELLKKIEGVLAASQGQSQNGTNNTANQTQVVTEKPESFFETPVTNQTKTTTTTEPETQAPVIDKNTTKAKNFSVEFTSKGGNSGKKGVQAKKITGFDIDALTQEESDDKSAKKADNMNEMVGFGSKTSENTTTVTSTVSSETKSTSYSGYGGTGGYGSTSNTNSAEDDQEKFKKFGNAKSISSDAFYGKKDDQPAFNAKQFSGSKSISSAQVNGTEEEEAPSSNATVDRLKSVASNIGEKAADWGGILKEKAGGWMSKFKGSDWSS
jgi:hypothetical protein